MFNDDRRYYDMVAREHAKFRDTIDEGLADEGIVIGREQFIDVFLEVLAREEHRDTILRILYPDLIITGEPYGV